MAEQADRPEAILAAYLVKHGTDKSISILVARGCIATIQWWCWENATDMIGTPADVDKLVNGALPPGVFSKAMYQAGMTGYSKGVVYLKRAVREAPDYIRRRWKLLSLDGYTAARRRSRAQAVIPPGESVRDVPIDLFGDPIEHEKGTPRGHGIPGHRELISFWIGQWRERYGATYPFQPKDARFIQAIIQATEDITAARNAIDSYLSCADKFFSGHTLGKLVQELPRFVGTGRQGAASATELREDVGEIPQL